MSEKGGNGHVRVEESITLKSNELLEAIFHYLAERQTKIGPGVEIQWKIDYHEGYNVPPAAIKDISTVCYLGT
jgi:hypothetical protein